VVDHQHLSVQDMIIHAMGPEIGDIKTGFYDVFFSFLHSCENLSLVQFDHLQKGLKPAQLAPGVFLFSQ